MKVGGEEEDGEGVYLHSTEVVHGREGIGNCCLWRPLPSVSARLAWLYGDAHGFSIAQMGESELHL